MNDTKISKATSNTLEAFSRLLDENCVGLNSDNVFVLTSGVRRELAVIQAEIDESRQRLKDAMLESASGGRALNCNDNGNGTCIDGKNTNCNNNNCTAFPLYDRISSLYESAEQTIQVAEAKVHMYLAKVEQVELKYGIELMRKDTFIRYFTRNESINR